MRYLSSILAAALASVALHAAAASPGMLWGVSTYAARGAAIVPATARVAAADARGDLYIAAADGSCVVALKYTGSSGALAWRRESCAAGTASAVAVAVDLRGDVVVAANVDGRFRLLKHSGATGAPMWDVRAAGGALDVAYGLALDGAGDILLLGKAATASTELWVAKHRGGDGALAWQQPVDGGAETSPVGIVADGGGNAIIAGNYRDSGGDDDWYAAKLAGSSGAILWRKVHDSGARDVASAVAVDPSGNVIVAGTRTATEASIAVVKSDGATGRTLWQNATAGGTRAGASQIAFDGGYNVVVAGFVAASKGNDIAVLNYAEASGALLWQSRQAGGGGNANGRSIATDAAGDTIVVGTTFAGAP